MAAKNSTWDDWVNEACQIPVALFETIIRQHGVQNESREVQIKVVAAHLKRLHDEDYLRKEVALLKIDSEPLLEGVEELAFNSLAFVLWAMPQENPIPKVIFEKMRRLRRKKEKYQPVLEADELTAEETKVLAEAMKWERGDGRFGIRIKGDIEHGIVFGQDRLALIWAITRAIQNRHPGTEGFTVMDYIDYYGLDDNGRIYDETVERFQRLTSNRIEVWWSNSKNHRMELMTTYLSDALIARPRKDKRKYEDEPIPKNQAALSRTLWSEIVHKRIVQLDANVVRQLKDSPGALDLYQFIAAKIFRITERMKIPLDELAEQLGMRPRQQKSHVRQTIKRWVAQIAGATGWALELKTEPKDILVIYPSRKKLGTKDPQMIGH